MKSNKKTILHGIVLLLICNLSVHAQNVPYILQSGSQTTAGITTYGSEILTVNGGSTSSFLAYQTGLFFQGITGDSTGDLFAVIGYGNTGLSGVYEFTSSGGVLQNAPSLVLSLGGATHTPNQIAIDPTNNLYVYQVSTGSITRYSPTGPGGAYQPTAVTTGSLPTVQSLAVDSSGNLYVAAASQGVLKYAFNAGTNSYSTTPVQMTYTPALYTAVTTDGATVFSTDLSFNLSQTVAGATSSLGGNTGYPLAVDGGGNLFTTSATSHLQEFPLSGGSYNTTPVDVAILPADGSSSPYSIAFSSISVVPEPSTWALLLAAILSLGGFSLRTRKFRS